MLFFGRTSALTINTIRCVFTSRYHRGFIVNVSLYALALAFAIFQAVQYWWTAKKARSAPAERPVGDELSSKDGEEK